ncbi:divergent polysaccharide deacetylase family protein [Metabacillus endolithicus]|uniref:Divergent polysaccharide deacetylase family protein n=1 Tax=Metabacillus endolithicus TaxID=1535204 RepID=A0ABW5BST3_9BACI|nr:divergent polysaccharide deacetylase family protein [Metabacillus endolithicus]UPG62983.1 divergent polysaccharide deacetylase family protein [Metabacillus endolithicus]
MKKCMISLILLLSIPMTTFAQTSSIERQVAIVIDDLGNGMKGTEQILSLPIQLTVAVMPFLPTTKKDANLANEKGHEVIVHLPMEPLHGKKSWLGPGAITTDLSNKEIRKRVNDAIDDVPHAVGMNNHMGSKVTADARVMKIILEVCKERGLYYLDSKTTGKSVVESIAKQLEVPYLENELFFDEQYTTSHITKQANLLMNRIEKDNEIIAIGHVGIAGEKTASVLKQYVPLVKEKAKTVTLSKLFFDPEDITNLE